MAAAHQCLCCRILEKRKCHQVQLVRLLDCWMPLQRQPEKADRHMETDTCCTNKASCNHIHRDANVSTYNFVIYKYFISLLLPPNLPPYPHKSKNDYFTPQHFLYVSWGLHCQHPGQEVKTHNCRLLHFWWYWTRNPFLYSTTHHTTDVRSSVEINALLNAFGSQTQIKIQSWSQDM